jgi:dephospho-CoA kinase
MALLLMHANATVTICHSKTRDLPEVVRRADIVVAAMGKAGYVQPDWIRPGATVIDVGTNRVTDPAEAARLLHNFPERLEKFHAKGNVLIGDVHPDALQVAGALTPVPGGVGPMTITMLMSNTVKATLLRRGPKPAGDGQHPEFMLRYGLTGGIASGKSAVAALLREMGFPVLDADPIAHKLMEPGQPARDQILQEFGAELAGAEGRIDRAKLGAIVFADPTKLAKLNAILHPRVEQILLKQYEEWKRSGVRDAAFVEAALLVEAGFVSKLDGLVVAWCEPEQQLERLKARGMSELDAKRRIAAQLPLGEKLRLATYIIDCSGTMESTRAQVRALAANLRKSSAS